jgi:hypothetical protein
VRMSDIRGNAYGSGGLWELLYRRKKDWRAEFHPEKPRGCLTVTVPGATSRLLEDEKDCGIGLLALRQMGGQANFAASVPLESLPGPHQKSG